MLKDKIESICYFNDLCYNNLIEQYEGTKMFDEMKDECVIKLNQKL